VLILYGGAGEMHKFALHRHLGNPTVVQGSDVTVREIGATWVIQWDIKPDRRVIRIGDLEIRLLWQNEAYNYWPMELSAPQPIGNFTSPSKELVIVKAGYLVHSAHISKRQLWLTRRKLISDHKCRIVSEGILNHNRLNYSHLLCGHWTPKVSNSEALLWSELLSFAPVILSRKLRSGAY
jgi:hypothetical protein